MFIIRNTCVFILLLFCASHSLLAQDSSFTQSEVIYDRKDGMALTMMVAKPFTKSNGKSIVQVLNGGYFSDVIIQWPNFNLARKIYIANGYTFFGVGTRSQPRYAIPDMIADLHRAVQYIRYNAKEYGIDPGKIGVTGGSSGGNLALLLGLQDGNGDPGAEDSIGRVSGKVQAVACYSPPCDFLNWGSPGVTIFHHPTLKENPIFKPAFDFKKQDTTNFKLVSISDTTEINKILWEVSPINYVTPADPPISIIHGDHDDLVPFQQSHQLILKLQQNKIPSQLKAMKSESHDTFPVSEKELLQICVDWFNKYLK